MRYIIQSKALCDGSDNCRNLVEYIVLEDNEGALTDHLVVKEMYCAEHWQDYGDQEYDYDESDGSAEITTG